MTDLALVNEISAAEQDFLLELLDIPGPSGFEREVGKAFAAYAERYSEIRTDRIGNQFATVNAGAARSVAIFGHMDEIGFIVTDITEHGLLRFTSIGGWDDAVPIGQRVRIQTRDGEIRGIIGTVAAHQLDPGTSSTSKIKDLWIDIGARDQEEAEAQVRRGDPLVVDSSPMLLNNRRIVSRSLDNRIGVFISLAVLERCMGLDTCVTAVGTVAEETAQYGAIVAAATERFDKACVIDVTFTSDIPGVYEEDVSVGDGPVIGIGGASQGRMAHELIEVAKDLGIPFQVCGAAYTGTDADSMMHSGSGLPTVVIYVPTRYLHMPGELLDLRDVEATIGLLTAWVARQ